MGKPTISMAIFNCYVSLPEGNPHFNMETSIYDPGPRSRSPPPNGMVPHSLYPTRLLPPPFLPCQRATYVLLTPYLVYPYVVTM